MFIVPVSRTTRGFDRFLDQTVDRFFTEATSRSASTSASTPAARSPALDVIETDRAYTVLLEMPGLTREDVKVTIEERRVTVTGQPAEVAAPHEGERVVWRERHPVNFARSFVLSGDIDQDQSTAKYENGVLTLVLTKRRPNTSQLTIN